MNQSSLVNENASGYSMKRRFAFAILVCSLVLFAASCNNDDDKDKVANPFKGSWTRDGVTVVLTDNAWTAQAGGATYNSGTYTYSGKTATMTVTNKGMGSAEVGSSGTASIGSDNKLVVSGFTDTAMNGTYAK